MKTYNRCASSLVFSLSFFLAVSMSNAAENNGVAIFTTVLVVGSEPDSENRRRWKASAEYHQDQAADDQRMRNSRKMMKQNGFVVAAAGTVDFHEMLVSSPDARNPADVITDLAFRPAAFDLGFELIGVLPVSPSSDGLIYTVTTLLRHPVLGELAISEKSRKEPVRFTQTFRSPAFDTEVGENSGFFTVFKTAEGDRGRSAISILTDDKLIQFYVGIPLTERNYLLEEFMEIAASLH